MNAKAKHGEWLDLLDERKGAFLSAEALAKKYPDGLEWTIPMKLAENRAKLAYKELTEIVDRNDERISLFQQEWIKFVLREVLELHDVSLKPREEYPAESDDSNCKFYPDYVLIDGDGKPVFFVVARDWDENLEKPSQDDAWIESPIDKTIRLCKTYEVNLALVTNGEDWTIVSVPRDLPSGYGTWRARYWDLEPKTFQAFATLFNVRNLRGRDLDQLFVDSYENQNAVTTVLGLQVRRAVEVLLQGLDRADADRGRELLKGVDARELYEAALTVMMRLL
ncbi:MAG: hypothetical protein IJM30_10180, partial [Thermoguttaceae bacterium]|nr:hypothetical protein [Thermoguttaceae bacterium]